jgi:dihydrofolate reductase
MSKIPQERRIVTAHMVSSIDGYVSSTGGDPNWMKSQWEYNRGRKLSDQDIASYLDGIDSYVIGANTYQLTQKLGWPYGDKPVYLMSQHIKTPELNSITVFSGTPQELLDRIIPVNHKNIWIAGGPMIVSSFLRQQLVDELIITIAPIVLCAGRSFFEHIDHPISLELLSHEAYSDGMIELKYRIHY